MATFNNRQPDEGMDYTRYSQGQIPDKSGAVNMIEGLDKLFNQGVKYVDDTIKGFIREDATQGVDQLRDRELNQGAREAGYNLGKTDAIAQKAIDQNVDRVRLAKDAAKSGQIGDSHYYLLLDAEARRLRARYPGHREYIDNVMSDLTGTTPANRALELLKAEARKNEPKDDTDMRNEINWSRENGGPLQEYIAANGRPPETLEKARKWNHAWGKQLSDAKVITSKIGADKAVLEQNRGQNYDMVSGSVFRDLQLSLTSAQEAEGITYSKIQAAMAPIEGAISEGRPVDPQQQALAEQQIRTWETQRRDAFNKSLYSPRDTGVTWAQALGPEGVQKLTAEFEGRLKKEIDPFFSKDRNAFAHNARTNEAMTEEAALRLRNSSKYANNLAGARKLVPEQMLLAMHNRDVEGLDAALSWYKSAITESSIAKRNFTKGMEEIEAAMKEGGKSPEDISKVKRATIRTMINTLQDPKTDAKTQDELVHTLFGDPRLNNFYSAASLADKDALFGLMVNPKMTERIMSSGNEETKAKYTGWVDQVVGARLLQHVDDVKANVIDTDSTTGLMFDPKTQTFKPFEKQRSAPIPRGANFDAGDQAIRARTAYTANQLNTTVRNWKAVMDKMGIPPENATATMVKLFQSRGVDIRDMMYKGAQ